VTSLSIDEPRREQADRYAYNPEDPVTTVVGFDLYGSQIEMPPR
jgi:hypothetical protein